MNAIVCVMDVSPHKIHWIAPTEFSNAIFGNETFRQHSNNLNRCTSILFDADFRDKLDDVISKSKLNERWGGVTRVIDSSNLESWIVYSVGPFGRRIDDSVKQIIYLGIDVMDLFNTPTRLNYLKDYLNIELGRRFLHDLTQRQLTVLQALTEGKSANQIAEVMGLSPYTIRDHKRALFKKFSCNSVVELVQIARMKGIVH